MAPEDRAEISDVLLDGLAVQVAVDPPSRPEMVPHVRGYAAQVTGESVEGGVVECRRVFKEIVFANPLEYFPFDQLLVEERQFFEITTARHLAQEVRCPEHFPDQRFILRAKGDLPDPVVDAGAQKRISANRVIRLRISPGPEVFPRELDAAEDMAGRVFCAGSHAIVICLDIPCVVQERADESKKDRVTVDGVACLDGPVNEPGHREKGVGCVLQIVIPGVAFGVSRIPSREETSNIGEDLVESAQIVFFHDSGERPVDFPEHQFRFPRVHDLREKRCPVGHDRVLSLSLFPSRRNTAKGDIRRLPSNPV